MRKTAFDVGKQEKAGKRDRQLQKRYLEVMARFKELILETNKKLAMLEERREAAAEKIKSGQIELGRIPEYQEFLKIREQMAQIPAYVSITSLERELNMLEEAIVVTQWQLDRLRHEARDAESEEFTRRRDELDRRDGITPEESKAMPVNETVARMRKLKQAMNAERGENKPR